MRHAVHAEWTKLRTVPSTAWSLAALIASMVALGALVVAGTESPGRAAGRATDTTVLALSGVYLGQIAVVLIAVTAVSTEYDTLMIRTTLAANPRRGAVLAAKALVVTAAVLAAGALGVLGSLLAGRPLLAGNGFSPATGYPPPSLADAPTLRAAVGTVLYLGLVALLCLGIATVLRHTAAAVTAALAVLYLPVLLALIVPMSQQTQERVQKYSPMSAGLAVQATVTGAGRAPIGPWAGLGVLAAYAGAGTALGHLVFRSRDG